MKRLLCIWFPNWPIQRLLVARPELKRRAVVLWGRDPRRGQRVVACSRTARQQGIRNGMPLPEATALLEHRGRPTTAAPVVRSPPPSRRRPPRSRADVHLAALGIWPHRPADDRQTLERLLAWAESFSPLVGLDEHPTPAGLLLDVSGIAARHGGEEKLTQHLQTQLRQQGYWGQLGLADTLGAAWALAHFGQASARGKGRPDAVCDPSRHPPRNWIHIAPPGETRQMLGDLPVAALRLSDPVLTWLAELGVEQIAQLEDLPRAGVASRLGAEVLRRIDQALGRCEEKFLTYQPAIPLIAQWQAEYPTAQAEVIQCVVEHLSTHLAQLLASQQQGALQLCCRLHCETGAVQDTTIHPPATARPAPVELEVSLFQPTLQADYLWQLLQQPLAQLPLPGPVASIELLAIATAPLAQRQRTFWDADPSAAETQQLAQLIDRLSNRLGNQVVCAARLRAGDLPETAYALIPLTGPESSHARLNAGRQRPAPAPGHRPLQLIHPPLPLQMISLSPQGAPGQFVGTGPREQVDGCWGPERIETDWWQGPSVRRDYYRVQCASGGRFWLFRDLQEHRWFLHGEFS